MFKVLLGVFLFVRFWHVCIVLWVVFMVGNRFDQPREDLALGAHGGLRNSLLAGARPLPMPVVSRRNSRFIK